MTHFLYKKFQKERKMDAPPRLFPQEVEEKMQKKNTAEYGNPVCV